MSASSCPADDCGYTGTEHGVKVHYARSHDGTLAKTSVCETCGSEYKIRDGKDVSQSRYCSFQCKTVGESEYDSLHALARDTWSKCDECQEWHKNYNYGRFCSTECAGNWREGRQIAGGRTTYENQCPECGETFEGLTPNRKFCSLSCRGERDSREQRGENHHNWSGFSQRHNLYKVSSSKREQVYNRDGHQCWFCGLSQEKHVALFGNRLHLHHVVPRVEFEPEDAEVNSMKNLITVCNHCHTERFTEHKSALKRDAATGV